MTPKEKAKELVEMFNKHAKYWDCYNDEPLRERHAQKCALILVNEVIFEQQYGTDSYYKRQDFWNDVKKK